MPPAAFDRLLTPGHRWIWRDYGRRLQKLLRFGETETDGGRDLLRAAEVTSDPLLRRLYLVHANGHFAERTAAEEEPAVNAVGAADPRFDFAHSRVRRGERIPVLSETRQVLGPITACHPKPRASSIVRPVYSDQRRLTNSALPSAAAVQISSEIVSTTRRSSLCMA